VKLTLSDLVDHVEDARLQYSRAWSKILGLREALPEKNDSWSDGYRKAIDHVLAILDGMTDSEPPSASSFQSNEKPQDEVPLKIDPDVEVDRPVDKLIQLFSDFSSAFESRATADQEKFDRTVDSLRKLLKL
jgi:hypothetical protein